MINLSFNQVRKRKRRLVRADGVRTAPIRAVERVLNLEIQLVGGIIVPAHDEGTRLFVVFRERYVGRSGGHAGRNRIFHFDPVGRAVLILRANAVLVRNAALERRDIATRHVSGKICQIGPRFAVEAALNDKPVFVP